MADTQSSQLGPNEWLVDEMYEQYVADPSSVSESWREFFADYKRDAAPAPAGPAPKAASAPTAPSEPTQTPGAWTTPSRLMNSFTTIRMA